MKSAENKTTAARSAQTQEQTRQPFFKKDGQGDFFSETSQAGEPFFSPQTIQPKLTIGKPGDKYEREADSMADKVVQRLAQSPAPNAEPSTVYRLPSTVSQVQRKAIFESNEDLSAADVQTKLSGAPPVQAKCATCEQEEQLQKMEEPGAEEEPDVQAKCAACAEEEPDVQTKSDNPSPDATPDLQTRLNSSRGSGQSLPATTRGSMESAFGADFSTVRVHTGSEAVQMSQELGAQAFTHGSDIYFNSGKYDTGSTGGKKLLAHELTHTVQQRGSTSKREAESDDLNSNKSQINSTNTYAGNKIQRSPLEEGKIEEYFLKYEQFADKQLEFFYQESKVPEDKRLTGKMFATAARKIYDDKKDLKYVVPIEYAMAQARLEGGINRKERTKGNVFNYWAFDAQVTSGEKKIDTLEKGFDFYYAAMAKNWLSEKTPDELLKPGNFTYAGGKVYATNPLYEIEISAEIGLMHMRNAGIALSGHIGNGKKNNPADIAFVGGMLAQLGYVAEKDKSDVTKIVAAIKTYQGKEMVPSEEEWYKSRKKGVIDKADQASVATKEATLTDGILSPTGPGIGLLYFKTYMEGKIPSLLDEEPTAQSESKSTDSDKPVSSVSPEVTQSDSAAPNYFLLPDVSSDLYFSVGSPGTDKQARPYINFVADVKYIQSILNDLGILSDEDYALESNLAGKQNTHTNSGNTGPSQMTELEKKFLEYYQKIPVGNQVEHTTIPKTIEAIKIFQLEVKGNKSADGRIDAGGPTLALLREATFEGVMEARELYRIKKEKEDEALKKKKEEEKKLKEAEKLKKEKEALKAAKQKEYIDSLKNASTSKENIKKIYDAYIYDMRVLGREMRKYAPYNPALVIAMIKYMDYTESDNLAYNITSNFNDAELSALSKPLLSTLKEYLEAGWTSNMENIQVERLRKYLNTGKPLKKEVSKADNSPYKEFTYVSQLDNTFSESKVFSKKVTLVDGPGMCNVTSLAMQLKYLCKDDDSKLNEAGAKILISKGYSGKIEEIQQKQLEDIIMMIFKQLGDDYFQKIDKSYKPNTEYGPHQYATFLNHVGGMFINYVGQISHLEIYDKNKTLVPIVTKSQYDELVKPKIDEGASVRLSTGLTGGHIVFLVDILEDGLLINDPYGLRMTKKYVNNGSDVEIRYNDAIKGDEKTLQTRLKKNPALLKEVEGLINNPRDKKFGQNLGELNFFTWKETSKWSISKWIDIFEKTKDIPKK